MRWGVFFNAHVDIQTNSNCSWGLLKSTIELNWMNTMNAQRLIDLMNFEIW